MSIDNYIVTPLDSAVLENKEQYAFYFKIVNHSFKELISSLLTNSICNEQETVFLKQYAELLIYSIEALRVKYSTGGTTPGDSYVWILDENYLPVSYQMYVPSMKMVAVPATWEDWTEMESGTMLPKNHTFSSGGKLSMGDVKGYN